MLLLGPAQPIFDWALVGCHGCCGLGLLHFLGAANGCIHGAAKPPAKVASRTSAFLFACLSINRLFLHTLQIFCLHGGLSPTLDTLDHIRALDRVQEVGAGYQVQGIRCQV